MEDYIQIKINKDKLLLSNSIKSVLYQEVEKILPPFFKTVNIEHTMIDTTSELNVLFFIKIERLIKNNQYLMFEGIL